MTAPILGFICGSLRSGSINAKLETALMVRAQKAGAAIQKLNLGTYDLPIFHGDLEQPKAVMELKADLRACDGLIIITPEYNGSLPALLKNAIDWVSITGSEQFKEPIYGIASCTPGALSGIMVLRELNYILTRVGAEVVTPHVGTGHATDAFDDTGVLTVQPSSDLADQMIAKLLLRISQKG